MTRRDSTLPSVIRGFGHWFVDSGFVIRTCRDTVWACFGFRIYRYAVVACFGIRICPVARSPGPSPQLSTGIRAVFAGMERKFAGVDGVFAGKRAALAGMERIFAGKRAVLAGVDGIFAGKRAALAG